MIYIVSLLMDALIVSRVSRETRNGRRRTEWKKKKINNNKNHFG